MPPLGTTTAGSHQRRGRRRRLPSSSSVSNLRSESNKRALQQEANSGYSHNRLGVDYQLDNTTGALVPVRARCHLIGLLPVNPNPPYTAFVYENVLAIQMAVKHLNAARQGTPDPLVPELTEVAGCPVDFSASVVDTEWNPRRAFAKVDELTDPRDESADDSLSYHRPCAVVGAVSSAVSKTTAMVTGLRGVPQVSHASTNLALSDPADYPLFARTIPDDGFMAEALIRFLHDTLNARHLFVIVESDPFPRSVLKSLRDAVHKLGWAPGQNATYGGAGSNQTDDVFFVEERLIEHIEDEDSGRMEIDEGLLLEAVDSLKHSDFRFVLALVTEPDMNHKLLEVAHNANLTQNHYWWFYETNNLRNYQTDAHSPLAQAYDGVGYIHQTSSKNRKEGSQYARLVRESYQLKHELYQSYFNSRDANEPHVFDALGPPELVPYNASAWFKSEELGYLFDKPLYAYDATILLGLAACRSVNRTNLVLTGEELFRGIVTTNFSGITGPVVLDPITGTRDGNSVQYAIDNWRAYNLTETDQHGKESNITKFAATTAYLYTPEGTWESVAPYVFSGNQTLASLGPHPDLPPWHMEDRLVEPWIPVVAFGILAVILLTTLGFAVWTCRHWNSRVVRASQPHFLLLVCLGVGIMGLAIVPNALEHTSTDQPDGLCASVWWCNILGFGIAYSTIFAKTQRINTIVASSVSCKRVELSIRETLRPVAAMLVFNVVMLSLMTTFRPLSYETTVTKFDRFRRPIEQYGNCSYDGALPFLLPIVLVNFGMVCLALFQIWRARNLSTEFAESKYIANALLISILVALLAVPVLILTQDNPNADTFINTILVSVFAGNTLCFLFVPKIHYLAKSKRPLTRHESLALRTTTIFARSLSTSGSRGSTDGALSVRQNRRRRPSDTKVSPGGTAARHPSSGSSSRQSSSGELILTTKGPQQLASENKALQLELAALRGDYAELEQRLLEATRGGGDKNSAEDPPERGGGGENETLLSDQTYHFDKTSGNDGDSITSHDEISDPPRHGSTSELSSSTKVAPEALPSRGRRGQRLSFVRFTADGGIANEVYRLGDDDSDDSAHGSVDGGDGPDALPSDAGNHPTAEIESAEHQKNSRRKRMSFVRLFGDK